MEEKNKSFKITSELVLESKMNNNSFNQNKNNNNYEKSS